MLDFLLQVFFLGSIARKPYIKKPFLRDGVIASRVSMAGPKTKVYVCGTIKFNKHRVHFNSFQRSHGYAPIDNQSVSASSPYIV